MNSIIRVLVVDDEKPARERLRNLLMRDPRVELVRCCGGGLEAVEAIRDAETTGRTAHVLFLDVQMPELDGFGVISRLLDEGGPENVPGGLRDSVRRIRAPRLRGSRHRVSAETF